MATASWTSRPSKRAFHSKASEQAQTNRLERSSHCVILLRPSKQEDAQARTGQKSSGRSKLQRCTGSKGTSSSAPAGMVWPPRVSGRLVWRVVPVDATGLKRIASCARATAAHPAALGSLPKYPGSFQSCHCHHDKIPPHSRLPFQFCICTRSCLQVYTSGVVESFLVAAVHAQVYACIDGRTLHTQAR